MYTRFVFRNCARNGSRGTSTIDEALDYFTEMSSENINVYASMLVSLAFPTRIA